MPLRSLRRVAAPLFALAAALTLMFSMLAVASAAPPSAGTDDMTADNLGWNFQVVAVNGESGAPNIVEPGDTVTYQANIWENSRVGWPVNFGRYITAARITAPAGFTLVDTDSTLESLSYDEGDDGVKFECTAGGCDSVPVLGTKGFWIRNNTVLSLSATYQVPEDYQPGNHMSSFHFDVYSFSSGQGGNDLIGVEVQDNRVETDLALNIPATVGMGTEVPLVANVTPADATGAVQFFEDGTELGEPVQISGGTATLSHTFDQMGSRTITAEYLPAGKFHASTAGPVEIEIGERETTLSVTVPPAAEAGSTVNLQATVTPADATGDVQFAVNGTPVGAPVQVTDGTAALNHSFGDPGQYDVSATFTGGFGVADSTADPQTIEVSYGAWETTLVVVEPVTAEVGSPTHLKATVRPIPTGGTVTFAVDGTEVGTADVGTADGAALLEYTFAEAGGHTVTATYSGTDGFDAATSPEFTATVLPTPPTLIAVDADLTVTGLAVVGQTVTLTVQTDPADAVGEVQFYRGAEPIGAPVEVVDGIASIETELNFEGTQILSATFLGGDEYRDSVASPVVLNVGAAPEIPDDADGSLGELLEGPLGEIVSGSMSGSAGDLLSGSLEG